MEWHDITFFHLSSSCPPPPCALSVFAAFLPSFGEYTKFTQSYRRCTIESSGVVSRDKALGHRDLLRTISVSTGQLMRSLFRALHDKAKRDKSIVIHFHTPASLLVIAAYRTAKWRSCIRECIKWEWSCARVCKKRQFSTMNQSSRKRERETARTMTARRNEIKYDHTGVSK